MSGRYDAPDVDAFTRAHGDAAAEGRLLIRRCAACGRAHRYPREFCVLLERGRDRGAGERARHPPHLGMALEAVFREGAPAFRPPGR